jgi:hypothetical protein
MDNPKETPWGFSSSKDQWVLWSRGPDLKFDLDPTQFKSAKQPMTETIANQTYDPTNGTISSGDIWRQWE